MTISKDWFFGDVAVYNSVFPWANKKNWGLAQLYEMCEQ